MYYNNNANRKYVQKISYQPGYDYTGWIDFDDEQPDGNGTMTVSVGPFPHIYTGHFERGIREGYGTMKFPDGAALEGQWVNNKMNGKGTRTWPHGDGSKYTGDFLNDKRHGKGIQIFSNGGRQYAEYDGNWVNDKREGYGVLKIYGGPVISGVWKNNMLNGKTVDELVEETKKQFKKITFSPGNEYEGQVVYAKGEWIPSGLGTQTFFKNGAQYAEYDGNWVNGEREGDGSLKIKDFPIIRGVWKNDRLDGKTVDELVEEKAKELELVLESKKMQYVELDKPISNEPDTLEKFLFDQKTLHNINSKWAFPLEEPYTFRNLYDDLKPSDKYRDVYTRWEFTTNKQHAIDGMVCSLKFDEMKELLKRFNVANCIQNIELFINFIKDILRINYWSLTESLILKTMEEKQMTRENAIKFLNPYSNNFIIESLRTTFKDYIEVNPFGTILNKKRTHDTDQINLMNPFKKDETLRWDEFLLIIMFFIKTLPISHQLSWAETYITSFAEAYDLKKCTFPNKIVTFDKREKEGEAPSCANGSFYHTLISLYYILFDAHPGIIVDEATLIRALKSEVMTELQNYRERHKFDVDEAKETELTLYIQSFKNYVLKKYQDKYKEEPPVLDATLMIDLLLPIINKLGDSIKFGGKRKSKKKNSGGKSKRGSRTAGWHAQAPGHRERTVMRKKCGAKCFLGPGTSFPVCTRGTCTINPRGVQSAYNRARQWGHVSVAKRAKRMLK